MNTKQKFLAGGILALAIAACQTVPPASAETDSVDVRQAMIDSVNPAALKIWDVGNNAVDDEGMPDGSKLDPATLKDLKEGAVMLGESARRLANAVELRASGPDLVGGQVPEGVATREEIQAAIDANPAGFRAYAAVMGDQADAIAAAIDSGDRAAVADRLTSFDGACQACHEKYWYVTQ